MCVFILFQSIIVDEIMWITTVVLLQQTHRFRSIELDVEPEAVLDIRFSELNFNYLYNLEERFPICAPRTHFEGITAHIKMKKVIYN